MRAKSKIDPAVLAMRVAHAAVDREEREFRAHRVGFLGVIGFGGPILSRFSPTTPTRCRARDALSPRRMGRDATVPPAKRAIAREIAARGIWHPVASEPRY